MKLAPATLQDASKEKEQGSVDFNLATSVSEAKGGQGFEIATPGRDWLFVAENKDLQAPSASLRLGCSRPHAAECDGSRRARRQRLSERRPG